MWISQYWEVFFIISGPGLKVSNRGTGEFQYKWLHTGYMYIRCKKKKKCIQTLAISWKTLIISQKQRKDLESEIPFPKQDAPVGLKLQHRVNSLLSQLLKMSLLISPGWLTGWMNSDSITVTYRCKCSSGFNCSLSQFFAEWRAMETSLTQCV